MPTYAYPTRSQVLDTVTNATLYDALNEVDIPQGYRNAALSQLVLKAAREPGLELQGQDLKLPNVGIKRKTMGGTRAETFVNFETGVTAQWFTGLDILNTAIGDGPTVTWSDWSYLTGYIAISGIDKIENTGPMKRLDILMSNQNKEIRKMVTTMETALWSTNTDATKGTQNAFAGLQHKVKIDPTTSTVIQGLNQSVFTPWANQYTTTLGSFAALGLDTMRSMYFRTAGVNAMEPCDLILNNSTIAGYLVKALEGIHRIVGSLNGQDLSASRLPPYMGIPIVHTDDCPSQKQYWLNTKYLENLVHENANWTEVIPGEPNDQWVMNQKRYVFGAAPLIVTRREKFGVIGGITA